LNKNIISIGICLLFALLVVHPLTLGNDNNSIQQTIDTIYNRYLTQNNYSYFSTCEIDDYEEYQDSYISDDYEFIEPTIPLNGPPLDSPWPMYCHDARHTGRIPYSTADTEGIEKWRFATDNDVCSGSPIIDKKGIIYVGASDMFAVYPNGTMKWMYKTDGIITSAPALDENGILYFAAVWGSNLHAMYSNNATVKWKYKIGETWASPTIGEDGIIYAPATDNFKVHAVYPNGTGKWIFKAAHRVYSSPAIGEDGTIYCTSYNGNLYALYPENGTEIWKYKVGSHIRTSPCIADDGTIYFGTMDNEIFAVNPNGTEKWHYNTGGWITSDPAIRNRWYHLLRLMEVLSDDVQF
jgi:hypothetical protein